MSAPTMLAGTAWYTRHDARTTARLNGFRRRLDKATDLQLLGALLRADRLPVRDRLADTVRQIVEHEVEWRRVTRPEFGDWLLHALSAVIR